MGHVEGGFARARWSALEMTARPLRSQMEARRVTRRRVRSGRSVIGPTATRHVAGGFARARWSALEMTARPLRGQMEARRVTRRRVRSLGRARTTPSNGWIGKETPVTRMLEHA